MAEPIDLGDTRLGLQRRYLAQEIDELVAENQKLREALKEVTMLLGRIMVSIGPARRPRNEERGGKLTSDDQGKRP